MFLDIEFSLTEECNLCCSYCSAGIPLSPPHSEMTLDILDRVLPFLKGIKFRALRISGGEPLLNPNFSKITQMLRANITAKCFILITNAVLLDKADPLAIESYDRVYVSHHVGRNDAVIANLPLSSKHYVLKRVGVGQGIVLTDERPNKGHGEVMVSRCAAYHVKKIILDRAYPCCVANGICTIRSLDRNRFSVPVTKTWLEDLSKLNIALMCEECFLDGSRVEPL
jgi:hypothetical protein